MSIHYLSLTEVAQLLGVTKGALARYKLPEPDVTVGAARGWLRETIEEWNSSRPGKGAGAGRPRKGDATRPTQKDVTSPDLGQEANPSGAADPADSTDSADFTLHRSTEADQELIHEKLRAYNHQYWLNTHDFSFHIEHDGEVIAGIVASATFEMLEVEFLFVDEEFRGRGLGAQLLHTAEDHARAVGARYAYLNTYSFQVPKFYPKQGYRQLFCVAHCLGPYSQYFFWKDLA